MSPPGRTITLNALNYQWEVAAKYWKAEAKILEKADVCMCFEMHPNFLVYNPETLVKLREVADSDRICANFDPSHLFWQGIDASAAIRWLGEKAKGARSFFQHVHAKDSLVYEWNARVNGVPGYQALRRRDQPRLDLPHGGLRP